jgi:F-type H+-transporting ATPase subunit b
MLIDWFTVIAQAANFLILVWLLKRFLYQPILNAIDAREQRIAAELADADAKKAEAQTECEEFQRKNDAFEQQRSNMLNTAAAEAKTERQRLLDAARQEAETLRARLQETLSNEQRNLNREITTRTQREVFDIARKALADLADATLEQRMVEMFIRRLRELSSEERVQLSSALKASPHPAVLRSTFDLPPEQQAAVATAVREILAAETQIKFETAPEQVSGIELISNGHKLAWSIADYLATMEKSVAELLQPKSKPETQQGADEHAS